MTTIKNDIDVNNETNGEIVNKHTFSIIIPEWPNVNRPYGLDYIDRVYWPSDQLQVIIAHGYSPCAQRNEAAIKANGDILVFFDNDSCPEPNYFEQLAHHFSNPEIAAVCGPNPGVITDRYVPNLVEAIFTNRFAVFSKRSRYTPTGQLRQCKDSDIIFCNFTIRRELYLQLGGLDDRLCPNEENEFLERFRSKYPEKILLYDPNLIAREPRSDTIRAFLRKICGYGQGRARQLKIRPSIWSILHMAGSLVPLLVILLSILWTWKGILFFAIPYSLLLLLASLNCLITFKRFNLAVGVGMMTFCFHIAYCLGLWKGLVEIKRKCPNKTQKIIIDYYSPQ